ncbi:hypothetical protein HK098_006110 [Nowakowskiella sp. JEL0407]|nr:hypothetical protein HK098_006110 [Nowakowskiella sp. JEL0407]
MKSVISVSADSSGRAGVVEVTGESKMGDGTAGFEIAAEVVRVAVVRTTRLEIETDVEEDAIVSTAGGTGVSIEGVVPVVDGAASETGVGVEDGGVDLATWDTTGVTKSVDDEDDTVDKSMLEDGEAESVLS